MDDKNNDSGETSLHDNSSNNKSIYLVIQRFRSCRILIDENQWVSIPRSSTNKPCNDHDNNSSNHCGLVIYVSFSASATPSLAEQAAQVVLNVPMITAGVWGDGEKPIGVLKKLASMTCCKSTSSTSTCEGNSSSLVIVPQANLISKLKNNGKSIQYRDQISKENGRELYDYFVESIRKQVFEEQCRIMGKELPYWYRQHVTTTQEVWEPRSMWPVSVSPTEIFKLDDRNHDGVKYCEWDETTGIPTKDRNGEPIAKSAIKKLRKLQAAHAKRHEKWKAQQEQQQGRESETTSPSFIPASSAAIQTDANDPASTAEWRLRLERAIELNFCPVIAGTFGKRQGFEMNSDMGPFCHVFQL